jgi:hypothetical protein
MGQIKYKGEVIYSGPLAEIKYDANWCNSMAEYYPRLWVSWVEFGELKHKEVDVPQDSYNNWYTLSEVTVDRDMADALNNEREIKRKKEQEKKLDYHKPVKVVRGRKVPIGTEGEIFWMGQTKFGTSVGIRLIDDTRVFTSAKNVEVITADEMFERELLGGNK